MASDKDYAQIKLPSGEIRRVKANCWATVGVVGNADHEKQVIGKAGNTRHRGRRGIPARWRRTRTIIRWVVVRPRPPVAGIRSPRGV